MAETESHITTPIANPLAAVLQDFNLNALRYCHWKSNLNLEKALAGEDDFDLLVHPDDAELAEKLLLKTGFRKMVTKFDQFHPGLFHYFCPDPTGKLFHVHLYPQILSGDTFLKNYRFPDTSWILKHTKSHLGVPIPNAGIEIVLLTLRLFLKSAHLTDWVFFKRDFPSLVNEWKTLRQLRDVEVSKEYLEQCMPEVSWGFYERLEDLLSSNSRMERIIAQGFLLKRRLSARRRIGAMRGSFLRLKLFFYLVTKRLFGTSLIHPDHFPRIIAFVGPPATGKSTLMLETKKWLSKISRVETIHIGKPPPTLMTLAFRMLLPMIRILMPGKRTTQLELKNVEKPSRGYLYIIRMIILGYERRSAILAIKRASSKSSKVFLCDRYPSEIPGLIDGSQFNDADIAATKSRPKRMLMQLEQRLYRNLPSPDLIVQLNVPLELAIQRNLSRHKDSPQSTEFIVLRHTQHSKVEFSNRPKLELNTAQSIEASLAQIRNFIWNTRAATPSAFKNIKALHILGDSKYGGDSLYAFDLIDHLKRRGGQGEICATDLQVVERARELSIPVVQASSLYREINLLKDLKALVQLVRICRAGNYDLIHTHTSKGGFIGRIAAWMAGCKCIIHTIHGFAFHEFSSKKETARYSRLEQIAGWFCDYSISVNDADRLVAIEKGILPESKVITILNGIDLDRFTKAFDRLAKRNELGVADDCILVGSVGRFAFQKDPLTFLKAAKKILISTNGKKFKFIFIGDGPDRQAAEKELEGFEFSSAILLPGFRTDVEALIRSLDIYVSTARYEGLPMTLLEAMAARVPIVATQVKGNIEVVDSTCAHMVQVENIDDVASNVLQLADSPARRLEITEAAHQRLVQRFDKRDMIEKTFKLYDKCLSRK